MTPPQLILGTTAAVLVLLVAGAIAEHGNTIEATRQILVTTARLSMMLFTLAFVASSARRLYPVPVTRFAMKNRRWFGLSFALSHTVHLAAIVALARTDPSFERPLSTIVFGGAAYVFLYLMAATSTDAAVRRMGAVNWRRLHVTGMYYIWFIFLVSYLPRAFVSAAFWPPAIVLLAAGWMRFAAARADKVAAGTTAA